MDNYTVVGKIRRFNREVLIVSFGEGTLVQVINGDIYKEMYKKLFESLDKKEDTLKISISFINNDYVSLICRTNRGEIPLNYSMKSGFFERDSVVLKYAGIRKKQIRKAVKQTGEKFIIKSPCVFLIEKGVGILAGEKRLKIRNLQKNS